MLYCIILPLIILLLVKNKYANFNYTLTKVSIYIDSEAVMLPGNSRLYYEDKAFLSKQQCIILSNNHRNIFSYKVTASFKDPKRSKKKTNH